MEFYQIGSDQGLMTAPVKLKRVTMAPAERADLLIDFSGMAGEQRELCQRQLYDSAVSRG